MATREQRFAASTRRGERLLRLFGEEVRHARIALGITQHALAGMVSVSQTKISRVEAGTLRTLCFIDASRVAAAVGLNLSLKAYPSERRPRDAGQLRRLRDFLSYVRRPLSFRIEVPLPQVRLSRELRAWDALISGDGQETGVELEVNLYDIQAQTRRIFLKRRDSGVDHLLVLVADTRSNRRVLAENETLLGEVPLLRKRDVLAALEAGRHPGTGIVLI